MADRPKTPPKAQRTTSSKDINYTFLVQPRILLRELMKKGLLHPLQKVDNDTPLRYFEAYCAYHQQKGHATNFCKILEATIIAFIEQGR